MRQSGNGVGNVAGALDRLVGRTLAEIERELVLATLTRCGGNRTMAADLLGVPPLELRDRLIGYNRHREHEQQAVARREAQLAADLHADGARATYVPTPSLLA